MTCEHVPTHPMAPTTRCRKCAEVIRRSLCPTCNGSGARGDEECGECRGTGKGAWVCVTTPDKP
jgi:DnaJ-class molecular chaperone